MFFFLHSMLVFLLFSLIIRCVLAAVNDVDVDDTLFHLHVRVLATLRLCDAGSTMSESQLTTHHHSSPRFHSLPPIASFSSINISYFFHYHPLTFFPIHKMRTWNALISWKNRVKSTFMSWLSNYFSACFFFMSQMPTMVWDINVTIHKLKTMNYFSTKTKAHNYTPLPLRTYL